MNAFSENLDRVMREKNVTSGTLSIKTGISYNTIRRYRSGKFHPSLYSAKLIADALGVSIDRLANENGGEKE